MQLQGKGIKPHILFPNQKLDLNIVFQNNIFIFSTNFYQDHKQNFYSFAKY